MKEFELLTTKYYRFLKIMYDNCVLVGGKHFVPMTQGEVAEKMGITPVTAHATFKVLQEHGMLDFEGSVKSRGRYVMSDKTYNMIRKISKVDK